MGGALAACLVVASGGAFRAVLGAGTGGLPSFAVDHVSHDAEITYTNIDPLTTPITAAVVDDGAARCFGRGATGNGCFDRVSSMVTRHGAAAGFTANYNNGVSILGLAVVDHHQWSPPDPHTTSLCVGDPTAGNPRPPVTVTKNANATVCRTAVSGERLVANHQVSIEGQGEDGQRGAFWWSVEENSDVQRTVVGVKPDGTVLIAVVSATRNGERDGMTLPAAARWLISQGVVDAIALDGGHQAEAYVAGRGSIVPLQAGEPDVQVSLLLDHRGQVLPPAPLPTAAPPPPPPAPVATSTPSVTAAPAVATPTPALAPHEVLPTTGALGSIVLPRLPESGVLPIAGSTSPATAGGGPVPTPAPPSVAAGVGAADTDITGDGRTAW